MIIPPLPAIPSPTFNPPTPSFTDLHDSTNLLINLLGREGPESADISRFRTTTDIVLSCLTTILACTWVAFHPNVPESHQSTWKYFLQRFGWLVVALIAPEYFAGIAIKERLAAKKYMDKWNAEFMPLCDPIRGKTSDQYARKLKDKAYDSRWTLTHGFLADMGGIRLYDVGDKDLQKFRPLSKIKKNDKMRPIIQQIGLISCDDIEDKSKGDWMTKSFVVIQTTWFIIQCLARWAIHLPVTELEVVTLAYAVQNIFIYILWWDKPQSLSVPFRLYLEKDSEQFPKQPARAAKRGSEQEKSLLPNSSREQVVDEGLNSRLPGSETLRMRCRHFGVKRLFTRLFGGDGYWLFLLLAGTVFGALHLIPLWLSTFPSDIEKKMWRVSAFYVTVAPLGLPIAGLVVLLVIGTALCCCCLDTEDATRDLTLGFAFCAVVAYAVARVILLVLPFTTLRFLPKEAFRSVEWARFIPHF